MTLVQWLVPQVNTDQALEIATTVKLARALWIIPIAFLSTFLFKTKKKQNQDSVLYWFVCTRYVREYVPTLCPDISISSYYYRKIGFDNFFSSVADFQKKSRISRLQTLTARNSAVVTNLFDGVVGG
jgi:hypothetical protein